MTIIPTLEMMQQHAVGDGLSDKQVAYLTQTKPYRYWSAYSKELIRRCIFARGLPFSVSMLNGQIVQSGGKIILTPTVEAFRHALCSQWQDCVFAGEGA